MKQQLSSLTTLLLFVGMSAFIVGCGLKIQGIELGRVVSAVSNVGGLGEKDIEEEIQIGEQTSLSLLQNATLANDDTLQSYVNKVGYWLAKHTSRPDLPWRFIVISDRGINAFAAPGGTIFITTGMIGVLTNEAELAGVLAHEIAHVLKRHHLKAMEGQSKRSLLADIAVLGAQTSGSGSYDSSQASHSKAGRAFQKSVNNLYSKGLERGDELEADTIGLQLVAKAGYDPYAFVGVLQAIQSHEKTPKEDMLKFTKTHPSADKRLEELEPTLAKLERHEPEVRVLRKRFIQNTRY